MRSVIIIVLGITLFCTSPVIAKSFWDRFKDPKDGKFDVSGWSEEEEAITGGFLPVPIINSEPAIGGLALGVGLLYIREKSSTKDTDNQTGKPGKETRKRPPVISGIAGAYSLNDSWLIGVGHRDNWFNDSLRYSGGLGYGSLNLDFYGLGQNELSGDPSIRFNLKSFFLSQDLKYRLFKSDFFLGARYFFLNTDSVFDISSIIPIIPPKQVDSKDGSLGPVLQYDTRDNIFTPTHGSRVDISAMFHDSTFGGDFTYQRYDVGGFTWLPVHKKVTLGLPTGRQLVRRRHALLRGAFYQITRHSCSAISGRCCCYGRGRSQVAGLFSLEYPRICRFGPCGGIVQRSGQSDQPKHVWRRAPLFDSPEIRAAFGSRYRTGAGENIRIHSDRKCMVTTMNYGNSSGQAPRCKSTACRQPNFKYGTGVIALLMF